VVDTKQPLVSAVIITHNRKNLLSKAIRSVESQTYQNIEIIVVDDASSDGTDEMVSSNFSSCRYFKIPVAQSRGGNHARNVGIRESKGDYIALLDDDDEWLPEKIERQIKCIREVSDTRIVGCLRISENTKGSRVIESACKPSGDMRYKCLVTLSHTSSTLLIERQLMDQIGGFDENLTHWQDYEMLLRACQHTNLECVNVPLVLLRHHDEKKDPSRLTNNLEKWEKAISYIESKHAELIAAAPKDIQHKRLAVIAHDGLKRCIRVGNKKKQKEYLGKVYRVEPSVKHYLEWKLNLLTLKPWLWFNK